MNEHEAKNLVEKYNKGLASPEEKALLEQWYLQESQRQSLSDDEGNFAHLKEEIWAETIRKAGLSASSHSRIRRLWVYSSAAAIVLIFISIGGYYIFRKQPVPQIAQKKIQVITPGSNKAILTIAGGKQIALNDAKDGLIAKQGNIIIAKTADGQIVYKADHADTGQASAVGMTFNTVATPIGGQYQVILPDGSHVWLNAASSIKYPTQFTGNERRVQLTGEAYFEVAHNKDMPFHVETEDQDVTVLGTHFNINSYADEPVVTTTLLEGSVSVLLKSNGEKKILRPGQASVCTGNMINVGEANTAAAVSWKNGYFTFKSADIKAVMRQFARWYDLDVKYEGDLPKNVLTGDVYRNVTGIQALKILSYFDIHYRVEGKKVIITN